MPAITPPPPIQYSLLYYQLPTGPWATGQKDAEWGEKYILDVGISSYENFKIIITERWSDDEVETWKRRLRRKNGLNEKRHVLLREAIREKREALWSVVALCSACTAFWLSHLIIAISGPLSCSNCQQTINCLWITLIMVCRMDKADKKAKWQVPPSWDEQTRALPSCECVCVCVVAWHHGFLWG